MPQQAITMGVGDILRAKKIVLVATGETKMKALKELIMNDYITTQNTCTLLKVHHDLTVIIDEALAHLIGYQG